jgi:23S rRNA (uracil1939-C5)-methyltransferase
LLALHPEITTLVQTINSTFSHTSLGESTRVLSGPGVIRERVCSLELSVSSNSFFQTNTPQAERLFELVRSAVAARPGDCVHDLYCGGGAISLVLAPDAREVVGFEVIGSAIRDARDNARRNGISNATFVEGDVALELNADHPPPQVCVTDPPRAGMHPKVLEALVGLAPRRIVYVSCNPHSAAREVLFLVAHGWKLARVQPVDLFPHTPHVECVLTLEREA